MIYGNLPPRTTDDTTTNFFENFFKDKNNGTSSNVNEAIIGYFQSITGNAESGATLAGSVLYVALDQGLDPMTLINDFRKMNPQELNAYLTMVLNLNRVGSSLLGLSNSPQPNLYIQRAVLP
jgi:hypothetical protein